MSITRRSFGVLPDGSEVTLFRLDSAGFSASILDWGATLVSFTVPATRGSATDIVLGFDSAFEYAIANRNLYFGSTIGRYANRIDQSKFTIAGIDYKLSQNDGQNHLHGGERGFHSRLWVAAMEAETRGGIPCLHLQLASPDGEEGYPGNLAVDVTYFLEESGLLVIDYRAISDKPTIVNMTNHAYFNLSGEFPGDILGHELRIAASKYIPVDSFGIPLGPLESVAGTVFDFRDWREIGKHDADIGGYDHCFALDESAVGTEAPAAELRDPMSGRLLQLFTSMPGIQLYTGKHLGNLRGKKGAVYGRAAGLCLESQYFPNSPNEQEYPSVILEPGSAWNHTIKYLTIPGSS